MPKARLMSSRLLLIISLLFLLAACSEAPRGIKRDSALYQFDSLALVAPNAQIDSSKEVSQVIPNWDTWDIRQHSFQEPVLLNFAVTLLANQNLYAPQLRYITYRSSCLQRSAPNTAFFAFVLPSEEIPAFPYIIASVELLLHEGKAILESDHVQTGWHQLDEPTFLYPSPVLFQDALDISDQYDSRSIEEKLGTACEVRALLTPTTWQLAWYASDSETAQNSFALIVDALTGDVIAAQFPDEN